MKKLFLFIALSATSFSVYAGGGFTWISSITHSLAIPVPEHVIAFVMMAFILVTAGLVYRSKLAKVSNVVIPDRGLSFRNIIEGYGQFIYNQGKSVLGEELVGKHFTFVASLFIIILSLNLMGLVPGFLPATEHFSTTFAFAVFVFIYFNVVGCKEMGTLNYLKHFAGPVWYMSVLIFPIEILSYLVRPVTLALRLKGNMMGDHIVLGTFTDLVPLLVPLPFYALGLLVCFIQAYVFTMLTMVYISLASEHHDHDDH